MKDRASLVSLNHAQRSGQNNSDRNRLYPTEADKDASTLCGLSDVICLNIRLPALASALTC